MSDIIIIQGYESSGKTTICISLEKLLIKNDFFEVKYLVGNPKNEDFMAVFYSKKYDKSIMICSAADTEHIIKDNLQFYESNKTINLLILTSRKEGKLKQSLDNIFSIKYLEIRLIKMDRKEFQSEPNKYLNNKLDRKSVV